MAEGDRRDIERVDDLVKPSEVRTVTSEPENVTIQRLKSEQTKFIVVVCVSAIFVLAAAVFLISAYFASDTTETMRDKIIIGFVAALSVALGILAGKKI